MISTNLRWVRASHGELGEAGHESDAVPANEATEQGMAAALTGQTWQRCDSDFSEVTCHF
jgi:hypothetical protein